MGAGVWFGEGLLEGVCDVGSGPFTKVAHWEWDGDFWDAIDEDGDLVWRFSAGYAVRWNASPPVTWLWAS